jgi:large subunit ribosomal protein L27
MATKKAGGSSRNGRDSIGRRLGVKKFGGEYVMPGNIIIRQRGTKYHAGFNTHIGKDHTIHANIEGQVAFKRGRNNRLFVEVVPLAAQFN